MIDINNLSGFKPVSEEELKHKKAVDENERLKRLREEAKGDRREISSLLFETLSSWRDVVKQELKDLPKTLTGIVGQERFHIKDTSNYLYGWEIAKFTDICGFDHDSNPIFICEDGDVYQGIGYSFSDVPDCELVRSDSAASYFCKLILRSIDSAVTNGKEIDSYPLFIPSNDLIKDLFDRRIEDFLSGRKRHQRNSLYKKTLDDLRREYGETHCFRADEDTWFLGIDPDNLKPYETKSPEMVKYIRERFDLDRPWFARRY